MKKISIIAAAAFMIAGFASCKSDYTCECTFKDSSSASQSQTFEMKNTRKPDAKLACETYQTTLTAAGNTSVSCSL